MAQRPRGRVHFALEPNDVQEVRLSQEDDGELLTARGIKGQTLLLHLFGLLNRKKLELVLSSGESIIIHSDDNATTLSTIVRKRQG